MSLGRLRWSEPVRAEGPFRSAAAAFAARGDAKGAEGEILARTALHLVLVSLGRPAAAAAEVARVEAIASRTGDPLLIARSQVLAARHLRLQGQDLERAYLLLHHAVEAAFPRGSFGLQRDALEELASVCHSLGRQAEERDAYHRLAGLAAAAGERRTEAIAHYGALRGLVEELFEMPCPEGRREVAELAGERRRIWSSASRAWPRRRTAASACWRSPSSSAGAATCRPPSGRSRRPSLWPARRRTPGRAPTPGASGCG